MHFYNVRMKCACNRRSCPCLQLSLRNQTSTSLRFVVSWMPSEPLRTTSNIRISRACPLRVQATWGGWSCRSLNCDQQLQQIVLTFSFLFIGGGVTLLVIALLVWLLVRRMLRPLEHLAVSASDIARTSDHALRVLARERPDEINSLAQTINGMLHSLEGAYRDVQNVNDLQRRFLADVSHELRTPLTIMLSSLDLMKKERGGDPEFQANALENIRIEAERMARLVTRLLMLARTDANAPFA